MLYLFHWNTDYLIREKTFDWKKAYIAKHGDFNLVHFKDIKNLDNNILSQEILAQGFMWEKKLIIIDNFPLKSSEKNAELKEKQDFLLTLVENIPETNIVLFSSLNPDKRSKFYKTLIKIAEVKQYNIKDNQDIVNIISQKYGDKMSMWAIGLIIRYKSWNLTKIFSEIEKLLISIDYIEENHIKEYIFPELEESIFQFIDDLLNLKLEQTLSKMKIILEQTNIYAFYNNFIANLRVQVFIGRLKSLSKASLSSWTWFRISDTLWLWNRWFLVNKNYKINQNKLEEFYISLINLDKKMKTWSMIASEDEVFINEIEKCILKIKA